MVGEPAGGERGKFGRRAVVDFGPSGHDQAQILRGRLPTMSVSRVTNKQ